MAKLVLISRASRQGIRNALKLLTPLDRRKFFGLTLIQSAINLLDLVSVAIVGIIASVAVNGINSTGPGEITSKALEILGMSNLPLQKQAAILGLLVSSFLVSKSIVSMLLNRKMMYFLSIRGATVSKLLISKLIRQNALVLESKSAQELIYSATTGINSIVIGILGNWSALMADFALCLILGLGLLVYSPLITILTILILGSILFSLFIYLNRESIEVTSHQTEIGIRNAELLAELLENYRESVVRNRRSYYARQIGEVRDRLSLLSAKQSWLPNISKYIIEVTVTLFTLLLAFLQFQSQDAVHAVGSLAIFLVAGARLAPSLLRIQQYLIAMNAHSTAADPTFLLFDKMKSTIGGLRQISSYTTSHKGFSPRINIENLLFSYPGTPRIEIVVPVLDINPGEFVAIVGPSGAGKSTLVDLVLGILEPSVGKVTISNLPPEETFEKWPGAVAYVAQKNAFSAGSLRDCITGGYGSHDIKDDLIWKTLEKVCLLDFVKELPSQLDEPLGEKAIKLSGGQRQRLAIARALLTEPKLLVMDEATSSLDSQTEAQVAQSIQNLYGDVTLLVVAHRLSTVMMADRILYMNKGKIEAQGSFDELRGIIPDFDKQAKLMGL